MNAVTSENFMQEVMQSRQTVLVDFWAPWCAPCRMLSPVVDEIAQENSDIKVVKINVDEEPELAGQFSVASIPNLFIIKDGKIVENLVGLRPKEDILAALGR